MSAWIIIGALIVGGATVTWLMHTEGLHGRRRGRHRGGDAR